MKRVAAILLVFLFTACATQTTSSVPQNGVYTDIAGTPVDYDGSDVPYVQLSYAVGWFPDAHPAEAAYFAIRSGDIVAGLTVTSAESDYSPAKNGLIYERGSYALSGEITLKGLLTVGPEGLFFQPFEDGQPRFPLLVEWNPSRELKAQPLQFMLSASADKLPDAADGSYGQKQFSAELRLHDLWFDVSPETGSTRGFATVGEVVAVSEN